jgi:hypothetical protein
MILGKYKVRFPIHFGGGGLTSQLTGRRTIGFHISFSFSCPKMKSSRLTFVICFSIYSQVKVLQGNYQTPDTTYSGESLHQVWFGLVWFYSYAVSGVAHADPLSSYRKRKTLWGIKTSPSAVLLSIC